MNSNQRQEAAPSSDAPIQVGEIVTGIHCYTGDPIGPLPVKRFGTWRGKELAWLKVSDAECAGALVGSLKRLPREPEAIPPDVAELLAEARRYRPECVVERIRGNNFCIHRSTGEPWAACDARQFATDNPVKFREGAGGNCRNGDLAKALAENRVWPRADAERLSRPEPDGKRFYSGIPDKLPETLREKAETMTTKAAAHEYNRGFYRDTDERMARDPAFASAVQMFMVVALEHGFTPGELKQIAFCAALEIELRYPRPMRIYADGRIEELPREPKR